MEAIVQKYQERIYKYSDACVFRKTKEEYGGLSNMASGFPLLINGIYILTSEALYQACRFPHIQDVQLKILKERSPMSAKMVSKPFRLKSRQDWDLVRVDIMYWCLKVKLAQNFLSFGSLLESTYNKPIVEDSSKDKFWGAVKLKDAPENLSGVNALGRLLMKLRQEYNSIHRFNLLVVEPPLIKDFLLNGEKIGVIDERNRFIDYLKNSWKNVSTISTYNLNYSLSSSQIISVVKENEPEVLIGKVVEKKIEKEKKVKKKANNSETLDLFPMND